MQPPAGFGFVSDPPLERVAGFIQGAWAPPSWIYDEALLAYHLRRPSAPEPFAVGLERASDGALVAYYAAVPLEADYQGRRRPLAFASFLVADASVRGSGAARAVQVAVLERARAAGAEAMLWMCEAGAVFFHSTTRSAAAFGAEAAVAGTFRYLAAPGRPLAARPPAPAGAPQARPYERRDQEAVHRLLEARPPLAIHRRHAPADLEHRLRGPVARSYVLDGGPGGARAFVHLAALGAVDAGRRSQNLYLQDLELGDLDEAGALVFLGSALQAAVSGSGAEAVFAPDTGYVPAPLLRRLAFRLAPRSLNLLVAPLRPGALPEPPGPVQTFYMDVY